MKMNEIGAIHNMFSHIFTCVGEIYYFDSCFPPEPPRECVIEDCTVQIVYKFVTEISLCVTDRELYNGLQKWSKDCIAGVVIARLSNNDKRIAQAKQSIYDATVIFAKYIDEVIQKNNPPWIEQGGAFHRLAFEEKIYYRQGDNKIIIPFVEYEGKKVMSYEKMFWYIKEHVLF